MYQIQTYNSFEKNIRISIPKNNLYSTDTNNNNNNDKSIIPPTSEGTVNTENEPVTLKRGFLRIGSFNIHGWKDINKKSNALRVLFTIQRIGVDIIGLQEVWHKQQFKGKEELELMRNQSKTLPELLFKPPKETPTPPISPSPSPKKKGETERMNTPTLEPFSLDHLGWVDSRDMETITILEALANKSSLVSHVFAASVHRLEYGNAILSKLPINKFSSCNLISDSYPEEEARSVIVAEYSITSQKTNNIINFAVCCLHLDHKWEVARLEQISKAIDHIKSSIGNMPHILLGDFNALKRSDFTNEKWNKIYNLRAEHNWETPRTDLINKLENEYGYIDSWSNFAFGSNENENATQKRKEVIESEKLKTCWANTRIDYIFLSKNFLNYFDIKDCKILEAEAGNTSDHSPIVVDIQIKE